MRRVQWLTGLGLLLASTPAAPAAPAGAAAQAPREAARSARIDGVSLGMRPEEAVFALVGRGYVERNPERNALRLYENGEERGNVVYRVAQDLDGEIVHEIDHSILYPDEGYDPEQLEREVRQRFGEPSQRVEEHGRVELTYQEDPSPPQLTDVIDTCKAELRAAQPELSDVLAEARARRATEYRLENRRVEKLCPGTLPMYQRMARFIEAPRLHVTVWKILPRVDTRLRWPRLAMPFRGLPAAEKGPEVFPATLVPPPAEDEDE